MFDGFVIGMTLWVGMFLLVLVYLAMEDRTPPT